MVPVFPVVPFVPDHSLVFNNQICLILILSPMGAFNLCSSLPVHGSLGSLVPLVAMVPVFPVVPFVPDHSLVFNNQICLILILSPTQISSHTTESAGVPGGFPPRASPQASKRSASHPSVATTTNQPLWCR